MIFIIMRIYTCFPYTNNSKAHSYINTAVEPSTLPVPGTNSANALSGNYYMSVHLEYYSQSEDGDCDVRKNPMGIQGN